MISSLQVSTTSWRRALSLPERGACSAPPQRADCDLQLARQRLEQWRQETALTDDARFALRLEQQGLDEQQFLHLLGAPAPSFGEPPGWLEQLETAYRQGPWPGTMPTEAVAELPEAIFLDFLQPLLDQALQRLSERLAALAARHQPVPLDLERLAVLWARPLPRQLLLMTTRTLMLELYIRRLEESLVGDSPEERFASFLDSLRGDGALDFLATYPVLGRALAIRVEQFIDVGEIFAERLLSDLPALTAAFDGELGDLVDLEAGLGDRHDGGHAVVRLQFAAGVGVLYKPKSLAIDVVFQELLAWLGEQGVEPRFRTLRVVDRGSYGWVEEVAETPCRNRAEIERFYARQGAHLAILYALEATDFHHENLIAGGEHPVLIDLETLFQPILADPSVSREDINPVATNVLRSGLLPFRQAYEEGLQAIDLSGLGAVRDHIVPARELTRVGTDEMCYVDCQVVRPVGKHLPFRAGEEIALWKMSKVILDSFARTYRKLIELKPRFLEEGGWLDRFAGLEIRVILRPTDIYARLVHACYHPDYLQDALHRERLFDKLWLEAERFPYIADVIPFERHDLWQGDFPKFTSRSDSCDFYTSSGVCLTGRVHESGLDLARRRVAGLCEEDLERQLALARLALAATRPLGEAIGEEDARLPAVLPRRTTAAATGDFVATARRLGERLEVLADASGEWISWFHLRTLENAWQLQPVGVDLYSGLAGIALFYAQLGAVTGEARFTALARRVLATARERWQRLPETERGLGAYSGIGGWIYMATSLAALWNEPELFSEAEEARALILPSLASDEDLDLIAGAAGSIASLLALHEHHPSSDTLAVAVACGDHLLAKAEAQEEGIAWRLPKVAELPLTGFAHGAAGIAWALAKLASATGAVRFAEAARAAIAYERHLFSSEHDNWPDLRFDRRTDEGWAYFHAWCHGSPGIGLGRLALLGLWSDAQIEEEIRAAVRSTSRHGFGGSHCLCHGDLGNLELLVKAGERLAEPRLTSQANELAGRILASLDSSGARCGVSSKVELPGLMVGLAGIGYGLLRLADPQNVPSVLLLETPKSTAAPG